MTKKAQHCSRTTSVMPCEDLLLHCAPMNRGIHGKHSQPTASFHTELLRQSSLNRHRKQQILSEPLKQPPSLLKECLSAAPGFS